MPSTSNETIEPLNPAESTLALILCVRAIERTEELRDAAGYPRPDNGQAEDMRRRQHAAVRALIVGMRAMPDGACATLTELDDFCEGAAQGALLAVLGVPPDVADELVSN